MLLPTSCIPFIIWFPYFLSSNKKLLFSDFIFSGIQFQQFFNPSETCTALMLPHHFCASHCSWPYINIEFHLQSEVHQSSHSFNRVSIFYPLSPERVRWNEMKAFILLCTSTRKSECGWRKLESALWFHVNPIISTLKMTAAVDLSLCQST